MTQRGLKRQIRSLANTREQLLATVEACRAVREEEMSGSLGIPEAALIDAVDDRVTRLLVRLDGVRAEILSLRANVRGPWSPAWLR